ALERQGETFQIAADLLRKEKFDFTWADPFNPEEATRSFVLLRDPGEGKAQTDAEEDLKVMAHILAKASSSREERNARSLGIYYRSPFGNSPAFRNLYLEGYGAIF